MSPYYVIELGGSIQVDGRQRETALRLSVYMGLGPGDSTNPQSRYTCVLTYGNQSNESFNTTSHSSKAALASQNPP